MPFEELAILSALAASLFFICWTATDSVKNAANWPNIYPVGSMNLIGPSSKAVPGVSHGFR